MARITITIEGESQEIEAIQSVLQRLAGATMVAGAEEAVAGEAGWPGGERQSWTFEEFQQFWSRLKEGARQILAEIIEPRVEEIFTLVHQEVVKAGYEDLISSGVVLTGGTASLRGLRDLAEEKLAFPVRVGTPRRLHGLVEALSSPAYATSVGLLLWGQRAQAAEVERTWPQAPWTKRFFNWFKAAFLPRR